MAQKKDESQPGTDLETIVDAEVVEAEHYEERFLPASKAWDQVDLFDRVEGFDLEQNKMELVGIPFIITRVVFREGAYVRSGEAFPDDYVSVECVTCPPDAYQKYVTRNRKRYTDEGVTLESVIGPDESIVFNDASTGIKRQIVSYLHSRDFIKVSDLVPQGEAQPNLGGAYGENPFDDLVQNWAEGEAKAREGIEVRLLVKRGLRPSKYDNDFAKNAITYYLA